MCGHITHTAASVFDRASKPAKPTSVLRTHVCDGSTTHVTVRHSSVQHSGRRTRRVVRGLLLSLSLAVVLEAAPRIAPRRVSKPSLEVSRRLEEPPCPRCERTVWDAGRDAEMAPPRTGIGGPRTSANAAIGEAIGVRPHMIRGKRPHWTATDGRPHMMMPSPNCDRWHRMAEAHHDGKMGVHRALYAV